MSPGSHTFAAVVVFVYLLVLVGVGAIKARKIKSQEDFSLAGRGLSTFVLVGTLLATWIGTGSIFGNAEETMRVGLAAFWLPFAGAVGIIALYLLAPRIRRMGQFTIQDILEDRFGVVPRIIGTITLICAYIIIVSYQYRAGAAVLGYLYPDLPQHFAVIGVAIFVMLYTALAGMYSVAYTDVANGLIMGLGLLIALPILFSKVGGLDGIEQALDPEQVSFFGTYSSAELISVLLPVFLLILGDANMYQRFFSAKSPAAARRSAAGMFIGVILLECAIIAVALAGAALVAKGDVPVPENPAHIIVHLGFFALPEALGAILIATVVAIVVSTADSYLLAPGTSLVRDVYQRFIAPDAPEKRVVFIGRLTVVFLGLVALGLAFTSDEFFRVALFAYTIYGAGITPALLAAFFWPRATTAGATASMVTGVGTAVAWKVLVMVPSGADQGRLASWAADRGRDGLVAAAERAAGWELDAVVPSIVVSVFFLISVSLLFPRKP